MDEIIIFNRALKRIQRNRAGGLLKKHGFLLQEGASRLLDHLHGMKKEFSPALLMGSPGNILENEVKKLSNIKNCIKADSAIKMLDGEGVVIDEELLPFKEESFDLILNLLTLHFVNDLPGALIQIYSSLKKDGLFIGSLFGGDTLLELKQAIMAAGIETGLSPRVSPVLGSKDCGGLLQRAKFSMPVVDSEKITVIYDDAFQLMHDLRGMGETNCLARMQKNFTGKNRMAAIAAKYNEMFGDPEGKIPATFEIITVSGSK